MNRRWSIIIFINIYHQILRLLIIFTSNKIEDFICLKIHQVYTYKFKKIFYFVQLIERKIYYLFHLQKIIIDNFIK
jgi:hypothetical protein